MLNTGDTNALEEESSAFADRLHCDSLPYNGTNGFDAGEEI